MIRRIRKLQVDDMLIALGGTLGTNGKMIMKNLKKDKEEHYTLKLSHKDFSFDLHKTKEGKTKEKRHKTLAVGKLEILEIVDNAVSRASGQSKISINDPSYKDFIVLVPRSEAAMEDFAERHFIINKDKIVAKDEESGTAFWDKLLDEKYFRFTKLSEINKYNVGKALVLSPEGNINLLFTKDGKHFLINQKEFEKLAEKVFTNELCGYLSA